MALSPWIMTVGILGNIVSVLVFLSPLPTFIQIYKSKSTLEVQSHPYTVAFCSAMLWLYYALLIENGILLISVNSIGLVIEAIYIVIFLFYATREARKQTLKISFLLSVAFTVIFVATILGCKGHQRVSAVGWICTFFSVCVFAAPLSIVFQVVRTRSVESMPLPLSIFLALNAVFWFTYGLLLRDPYISLPNILGFILTMLQIILYGIYRNANTDKSQPQFLGTGGDTGGSGNSFMISGLNLNLGGGSGSAGGASSSMPNSCEVGNA